MTATQATYTYDELDEQARNKAKADRRAYLIQFSEDFAYDMALRAMDVDNLPEGGLTSRTIQILRSAPEMGLRVPPQCRPQIEFLHTEKHAAFSSYVNDTKFMQFLNDTRGVITETTFPLLQKFTASASPELSVHAFVEIQEWAGPTPYYSVVDAYFQVERGDFDFSSDLARELYRELDLLKMFMQLEVDAYCAALLQYVRDEFLFQCSDSELEWNLRDGERFSWDGSLVKEKKWA